MARARRFGEATTSDSELKHKAKLCGSHYFDRDTMRFFKSRIVRTYADRKKNATCFVTSEQGPYGPRKLTVSKFKNCKVERISEFQEYPNTNTGKMMAKSAAARACGHSSMFGGAKKRRRKRK